MKNQIKQNQRETNQTKSKRNKSNKMKEKGVGEGAERDPKKIKEKQKSNK